MVSEYPYRNTLLVMQYPIGFVVSHGFSQLRPVFLLSLNSLYILLSTYKLNSGFSNILIPQYYWDFFSFQYTSLPTMLSSFSKPSVRRLTLVNTLLQAPKISKPPIRRLTHTPPFYLCLIISKPPVRRLTYLSNAFNFNWIF